MAAKVSEKLWSMEDVVRMIDLYTAQKLGVIAA